jgi:rare lipoprotein A
VRLRRCAALGASAILLATGIAVGAAPPTRAESCMATYYDQGTTTANGERFDPDGLTAAHRTLPFGTMVQVTDTDNGSSVVVRINDRGPFAPDRCIDLTRAAFARLAPTSRGVVPVVLTVTGGVPGPDPSPRRLAARILADKRITLATGHLDPRGEMPPDGASAHDNIADTAHGRPARRSPWAGGDGGTVALDPAMLRGMLDVASGLGFDVAEIAGGSAAGSSGAAGRAFDVDAVDGDPVTGLGAAEPRLMDACRAAGASEVGYQGLRIHCGWPA